METIKLQNILYPREDICMEEKMYFRCRNNAICTGSEIRFEKGSFLGTDTYFNSVSADKWGKYTEINNFDVTLSLKGDFRILLISNQWIRGALVRKVLSKRIFHSTEKETIKLQFPKCRGMTFFTLESLSDGGVFYGGCYAAEVPGLHIRAIHLAVAICTYRRESYIEHNLEVFRKYLLNDKNSELAGKLDVFIADNGQTLDIPRLSGEHIHIVKNKNAGGTAGFTRCMIEIMEANKAGTGITHILLMDDDVTIEPESLLKTYRILSVLKPEYENAFIGGAMLRSDWQNIQIESGAIWNGGDMVSLKHWSDMNDYTTCLRNEIEEYTEYNAWWYCCFPVSVASEENLPMPLFIRGDDVEYGLRSMKQLILMNGICVWHEPFENKYSSAISYYVLRNQFIDNALHCPWYGRKQAKKAVRRWIMDEILYYRYKNVDLIIRGVRDFLKGVDWLKNTDGEKNHKDVLEHGYKMQPVEALPMSFSNSIYENSFHENYSKKEAMIRKISVNGYLLRAKRDNIAGVSVIRPVNAYRVNRILNYDELTGKGFITERNRREAMRCIRKMRKLLKEMEQSYDKTASEYRDRCRELQNVRFWRKYLEIDRDYSTDR